MGLDFFQTQALAAGVEPGTDGEGKNVVEDVNTGIDCHAQTCIALGKRDGPEDQLRDSAEQPPEILVVVAQEANDTAGEGNGEGHAVVNRPGIIGEAADQGGTGCPNSEGEENRYNPFFDGEGLQVILRVVIPGPHTDQYRNVQREHVSGLFKNRQIVLGRETNKHEAGGTEQTQPAVDCFGCVDCQDTQHAKRGADEGDHGDGGDRTVHQGHDLTAQSEPK